jgi:hypothetical protein
MGIRRLRFDALQFVRSTPSINAFSPSLYTCIPRNGADMGKSIDSPHEVRNPSFPGVIYCVIDLDDGHKVTIVAGRMFAVDRDAEVSDLQGAVVLM